MANEKQINSRIQHKHDTEANWIIAGNAAKPFVPKQGEIIIYDTDNYYDYQRMKIGDGITSINSLKFIDAHLLTYKDYHSTTTKVEVIDLTHCTIDLSAGHAFAAEAGEFNICGEATYYTSDGQATSNFTGLKLGYYLNGTAMPNSIVLINGKEEISPRSQAPITFSFTGGEDITNRELIDLLTKNAQSRTSFNLRTAKHDTYSNWLKSVYASANVNDTLLEYPFIPEAGEIIVYDADKYLASNMKIGDGVHNVDELPFEYPLEITPEGLGEKINDFIVGCIMPRGLLNYTFNCSVYNSLHTLLISNPYSENYYLKVDNEPITIKPLSYWTSTLSMHISSAGVQNNKYLSTTTHMHYFSFNPISNSREYSVSGAIEGVINCDIYVPDFCSDAPVTTILSGPPQIYTTNSSGINLYLPYTLKSIGVNGIYGIGIASVYIPKNVTTMSTNAIQIAAGGTIYCESETDLPGWEDGWYDSKGGAVTVQYGATMPYSILMREIAHNTAAIGDISTALDELHTYADNIVNH